MTKDDACPRFSSFLFNDPKFWIPETKGKVPANCLTIGSAPVLVDAGTTPSGTSRRPLSVLQGDDLKVTIDSLATAMALSGNAPKLLGPCAPGGAVPWPGRDHITLFTKLNTTLFGPSEENIKSAKEFVRLRSEPTNRLSTVMVLSNKDRGKRDFSALFTGDAHDRVPSSKDIRGTVVTPQHFSVMKVPHHGSARSTSADFYHQYTADVYLISSHYGNHQ